MNDPEAMIFNRIEYHHRGQIIKSTRYDYRYPIPRAGEHLRLKGTKATFEVYRVIYTEATGTVEIHL